MEELIEYLTNVGVLRTPNIIQAFRAVDRKDFVPQGRQEASYADYPLAIGYGQTISQPYTVAFMLELLQPQVGDKILDVGSGSGWTTALLAQIVGPQGLVFGTELIPELISFGRQNLQKYRFSHATIVQAGKKLGLPNQAPFDKILVSAAAKKLPTQLLGQLTTGGILVIPVKNDVIKARKVSEKKTTIEKFPGFAFVPLLNS